MTSTMHILAEGLPPGLIFGAVVVVFWALGTIVNSASKKPNKLARPSEEANQLAAIRRRMLEEQARAKRAAATRGPGKSKGRKQSQPPPQRPVVAAPVAVRTQPAPTMERVDNGGSQPLVRRVPTTDTARNVRLLLQRNGAAEAFVLAEILGKPKAMQDDEAA